VLRKFILLASLLLLPSLATAQYFRYDGVVQSNRGPIGGQSVAVCSQPAVTTMQPCSPLVTLYQTPSGGALTNPTASDTLGNFHFYVAAGIYTVQIYGPQVYTPYVMPDQAIGLSVNAPCNSGELCVDTTNTAGWAGVDAGAWINSAMAALPANGGRIRCSPGVYSFATQINFTVPNVTLECAGSSRTFTPVTGTQSPTLFTWTGGATPVISINAPHVTLTGFAINNTGTATMGIFVNGQGFFTTADVSIDHPTVVFSSFCVGLAPIGSTFINIFIHFNYSNFQACAPIIMDIDHANLVTFNKTNANYSTGGTANVRVGNTGLVTGLWIGNGSDFEDDTNAAPTAAGIDFIRINKATIRDSYFEMNAKSGQFNVRVGSTSNAVSIFDNYIQGLAVENFCIQLNGGTNTSIHGNLFTGCVTDSVNNTGGGSFDMYENVNINGGGASDSLTGMQFTPDITGESFGITTLPWAGFFSGVNCKNDTVTNGGCVAVIDSHASGHTWTIGERAITHLNFQDITQTGGPYWGLQMTGTNFSEGLITAALTSNRAYTFPDGSGGLPVTSNFTTAGGTTSDVLTIQGMTVSGHCVLSASNASAATGQAAGTTWLDTAASNAITLHHTATNGQIFTVACTPN
jgi:hypothetical protein